MPYPIIHLAPTAHALVDTNCSIKKLRPNCRASSLISAPKPRYAPPAQQCCVGSLRQQPCHGLVLQRIHLCHRHTASLLYHPGQLCHHAQILAKVIFILGYSNKISDCFSHSYHLSEDYVMNYLQFHHPTPPTYQWLHTLCPRHYHFNAISWDFIRESLHLGIQGPHPIWWSISVTFCANISLPLHALDDIAIPFPPYNSLSDDTALEKHLPAKLMCTLEQWKIP